MRRLFTCCVMLFAALMLTVSGAAAQANPFELLVFDTRADMELLADAVFGAGIRPEGWINNDDLRSPTVVNDLWFDNELLADAVFGPGVRPPNWIGVTVPNVEILARNVRHDLELSANEFFGAGDRPDEWRGAALILQCSRTLQNIITVLDRFYNLRPTTPESVLRYCETVEAEITDSLVNIVFGTPGEDNRLPDPFAGLSAVRGDLERLADELLGLSTRPPNYLGGRDVNAPSFIGDVRLDLESLADDQLGEDNRPAGWIGTVSNNPATAYLILRHDLELLADVTLGVGTRPTGWQGEVAIERCDPLTRSLAFITQQSFEFSINELDPNAVDFCAQVSEATNALVENPPVLDIVEEELLYTAESNYAFSYLDVAATEYMGVMPGGVRFRALYRNFGDSNMMFVQGDNFAVYVDMRFTSLTETTFRSLPTLEGVDPLAFCDAFWCNGPGPTPTPTGSGPLLSILVQTTPVAVPDADVIAASKQLVSWNYVRVTYVFDNVAAGTAQVALEVCAQVATNATACEPVINVFDNNTGTSKPVISQFNGLNVYEFRYGYSTNLLIEAETLYSTDVWISDPTIR